MDILAGVTGLVWLVARPCLVQRLLAACWQGWVTSWLFVELKGAQGWGAGSLVGGVGLGVQD